MKRRHDKRFTVKQPEVIVNIQPKVQPKPTVEPLYCIEENVTTGWEILETNLNKENARAKYNHYADILGVNPNSLRLRRIQ